MKKYIVILACLLVVSITQAQDLKPVYKKVNNQVKVTYFFDNGKIKETGFFKDKKLDGTWIRYNLLGNKIAIAHYDSGKKVGKWFLWQDNKLKEISYKNNAIAHVQIWKEDHNIAKK